MPVRRSFLIAFALVMGGVPAHAQPELHFDGSVPVHKNGVPLRMPWAGGLNFVHASEIDLNGDGLKDLFLYDRSGNVAVTLLNNGVPGQPLYTHTRAYDHVHPFNSLQTWVLLRDYNCDGLEDLFMGSSSSGVVVYRNVGGGAAGPAFELVTSQLWFDWVFANGNTQYVNMWVLNIDMPGLIDVDGDGDLDILTFGIANTALAYNKNLSMELYGTCDSLTFELRNNCWGYFNEDVSDNTVTLDAPCPFNVPNPEIGTGEGHPSEDPGAERAHAGSTVTPLDLNGDGLLDLLLGDISYNNLVALYNGGTPDLAYMAQQEVHFPEANVSVDMPVFPGACHLDLDNDGARDLLISPHATSQANSHESVWFYKNMGTDAMPDFQFQSKDIFQSEMIDLGEGAYPVVFDHDGDGLMDIVVSNHGYYTPGSGYTSQMALLRNTGTATEPSFELVTTDYMGLSTSGIPSGMYPAFGDLDGDGDLDMYVGDLEGRIHFYRNVSSGPVAEFQLVQPNITHSTGQVLDVGQASTPQLFDLDNDGLLDLLIGEMNGNLNYYRNTGTAQVPAWTHMTDSLGGVDTRVGPHVGRSVPFMYRNADGELELLMGSGLGWVQLYTGIEGNITGTWELADPQFLSVRDGERSSVALYDFTGDGHPEMIMGNMRGGLSFWRGGADPGVNVGPSFPAGHFGMFPNPAMDQVVLELDGAPVPGAAWVMYNAMGQEVQRQRAGAQRSVFRLEGIALGTYLMRLEGGDRPLAQRLVVMPPSGVR